MEGTSGGVPTTSQASVGHRSPGFRAIGLGSTRCAHCGLFAQASLCCSIVLIRQANSGLEKSEIEVFFKEADKNGDKAISKDEFIVLMKSTGAFDHIFDTDS